MCNLFHQSANALKPIYQRMLEIMPSYSPVIGDETPLPVQTEEKTHRGFMWSFIHSGLHPPTSPMGKAIAYALNNWTELTRFVDSKKLPLDNNKSERALRIIAIGRKNYQFAGNNTAAENLAGLYSLIATCELHDVNPEHYLADVLIRMHTHPQQQIDELLPHRWKDIFRQ